MKTFTVTKFMIMQIIINKKTIKTQSYSFKDDYGNTIIIVYGEGNRDYMIEYLSKTRKQVKEYSKHKRIFLYDKNDTL